MRDTGAKKYTGVAAAPYAQAANRKNADKKIVVENDAKQKCFG